MERLYFTQNNKIAVGLGDITAESAFKAQMEILISKYPYTTVHEIDTEYIFKPDSLAAFNALRDLLEIFVQQHPLTKVEQLT